MVISLSEFNNLNEKEKKKTLQELKNDVGVSGLVEAWDVSRAKIYSMLHELNVPVNPRKPRKAGQNSPDVAVGNRDKGRKNNRRDTENMQNNEPSGAVYEVVDVMSEDSPKFTLSLDTQGNASTISETLQVLLSSGRLENSNLHLNLRLEEV